MLGNEDKNDFECDSVSLDQLFELISENLSLFIELYSCIRKGYTDFASYSKMDSQSLLSLLSKILINFDRRPVLNDKRPEKAVAIIERYNSIVTPKLGTIFEELFMELRPSELKVEDSNLDQLFSIYSANQDRGSNEDFLLKFCEIYFKMLRNLNFTLDDSDKPPVLFRWQKANSNGLCIYHEVSRRFYSLAL